MQVTGDTLALLRALSVVLEANKGMPAGPDERVLDAEGLALKCFFHAISCFYLQRSTTVPEFGASFFDPASMNVLSRATIESFLVFHYVFAAPETDEERELRHSSWVLADLVERQELPVSLPESKEKQRQEKQVIQSLMQKIQRNSEFQKLSLRQQKALLDKKQWRRHSWTEIARNAGLSRLHAEHMYRYLCSYAHSGSLSVMQVRQAETKKDQQFLAETTLRLINVALAFMTKTYCSMFEKAQVALLKEEPLKAKVDEWARLGAGI